ncbi:MAG: von Willebrand factor type A domain-containing protein [Bacteroidota bacterium]
MKKYRSIPLLFCLYLLANVPVSWAELVPKPESGIEGVVFDGVANAPFPDAHVVAYRKDQYVDGAVTNHRGFYQLSLKPGKYDLVVTYIGCTDQKLTGVSVRAQQYTEVNVDLGSPSGGIELSTIIVREFEVPLIEQDHSSCGSIVGHGLNKVEEQDLVFDGVQSHCDPIQLRLGGTPAEFSDPVAIDAPKNPSAPLPDPIDHREEYQVIAETDFVSPRREIFSTFSIDVDRAAYGIIRRDIQRGIPPAANAARTEEMVNYFDYQYPSPQAGEPFAIYTEVHHCPWNRDHQLLHIGLQGRELDWSTAPPNNLVFLIDVSGSMRAPNKLPLLQSAFKLLIQQLRPQDRVSIVVYAGAAGLVLPPTAGSASATIQAALDTLRAGGSTGGAAGIQLAYQVAKEQFIEGGNNRVILATDGDFNVGASSPQALEDLIVEKRGERIFLTVLGFGYGNLKDNRLETLADRGNGNYAFIDSEREAHKIFVRELTGTLVTIAKDVKAQVIFDPQQVRAYRLIGYENRRLAPEDFADDAIDAGELGAGHTVTALYEIIPTTPISPTRRAKPLDICPVDGLPKRYASSTRRVPTLATLNLRYKAPDGERSQLLQTTIPYPQSMGQPTERYRFAAAVAGFSLLLRDSKYRGDAKLELVSELARGSLGADPYGDRANFVKLVETYRDLGLTSSK